MQQGIKTATGITAGTATVTPNETYEKIPEIGNYLANHAPLDIGVLSYAEYIKIIGAIYIIILSIGYVHKGVVWFKKLLKEKQKQYN